MKCVCSGCMLCYIGVYQCGLWNIVQVCLCGDWWFELTFSPHTNRSVQYSLDRTDKHLYNTAWSHYTHTSYYPILYSAENHMLQLNI